MLALDYAGLEPFLLNFPRQPAQADNKCGLASREQFMVAWILQVWGKIPQCGVPEHSKLVNNPIVMTITIL